jgi:hypothetical protein
VSPTTTAPLNGGCVAFAGFDADRGLMKRRADCADVKATQLTPTENPTIAAEILFITCPPSGATIIASTGLRTMAAGNTDVEFALLS